VKKSAIEGTF